MKINPAIIKAYDIRGLYPSEINKETAFLLGRAYVAFLQKKLRKKRVALSIGRDFRFSSDELARFFMQGATEVGADVTDVGVVTTPLNYFAVSHLGLDGGAMITASHNGPEYNGVKFILRKGKEVFQIGKHHGLSLLPGLVGKKIKKINEGVIQKRDIRKEYIDFLFCIVSLPRADIFPKLKIVVDASGGAAISVLPELLSRLGIMYKPLFFEPDPWFVKHSPNPLKPESQRFIQEELKRGGYAFGVVFDGDVDRAQFFDERGRAVPNGFIAGVLAGAALRRKKGSTILIDPFVSLGVEEYIRECGGTPQRVPTGTAFVKDAMKKYKAVCGGEWSGHFYFREFFGSDSALVAFLSVLKIVMQEKKVFSALVRPLERYTSYFTDAEISKGRAVTIVHKVATHYKKAGAKLKKFDGISIMFPEWRAHIRSSNTEPMVRVFVEAKTEEVAEEKMREIISLVR